MKHVLIKEKTKKVLNVENNDDANLDRDMLTFYTNI